MNLVITIVAVLGFLLFCYVVLICVVTKFLDRNPGKFVSGLDHRKDK